MNMEAWRQNAICSIIMLIFIEASHNVRISYRLNPECVESKILLFSNPHGARKILYETRDVLGKHHVANRNKRSHNSQFPTHMIMMRWQKAKARVSHVRI